MPALSCAPRPAYPTLVKAQKTRDVRRFLESIGWVLLRDAKGSHEIWGLPDGSQRISMPFGHSEVSAHVLSQLRSRGVEVPEGWK